MLVGLASFLLLASVPPADLAPVHWPSGEVKSLELLKGAAWNCLLVEEPHWTKEFVAAAHARQLVVLGLVGEGKDPLAKLLEAGLDGAVWEGRFEKATIAAGRQRLEKAGKLAVVLGLRGEIPLGEDAPPIIGTHQGVWAGINPREEGEAHAAPSGAPWIDTNAGFLRFVRAATSRPFWLSARPPKDLVITLPRYLQMIADPAMVGARWVFRFEGDFFGRLEAGEARARKDFERIQQVLRFFEQNRGLQSLPPYGQLAVVTDVPNGALLSGSVLDMITVKHTPVRPVPLGKVAPEAFDRAKMAVNVDPPALNEAQQQVLRNFTRGGGTVLSAPPGWRMPEPRADQVTTDAEEVKKLDQIWKEVNGMTGRRNLGVRLFNVSSLLSNLLGPPDGSRVVIYLVNYSDFPVDTIAVHLLGNFSKATVYWPERGPRTLMPYEIEEGTGVDIDILESAAILIAEK